MSARELRDRTVARVRSTMTTAMRADSRALDTLAERNPDGLDACTLTFLRTGRTLTLATSAALTTILGAHRYGRDPYDRYVCLACGIERCRTVRAVSDVLAAYGIRMYPIDRPEAWGRADAWYADAAGHPVLLSIESFDEGFIARPATSPPSVPDRGLVIDRDTGALILWPAYDTATLIGQYHAYKNSTL
ncbi:hypothetical protein ACQPZ8_16395 [Actinomadura nitritigenes]|uniref:hypothetical protein n=1 Tax=Actinomadura nitritigenes TaxID=134602 RepID=UPI003D8D721B